MRPFVKEQGKPFGGGVIVAKDLVQVAVIKFVINHFLERAEFTVIAHEPPRIKLRTAKLDFDNVIMPVQARTRVIGIKPGQLVAGGKGELFGDGEHHNGFRYGAPVPAMRRRVCGRLVLSG
jgi:hypothetical protein